MPGKILVDNPLLSESGKITKESGQDLLPILIIDDDNWIHRVIGHYLQSWGFTPISALDAIDGISKAIKIKPILILLDIVLPEIKGDVLLRMLKAIDITSEIPVLILSGNLNVDIVSNTFKSGALGYIAKPFTQETLFNKIKEAINPEIFQKLRTSDSESNHPKQ